MRHEKVPRRAHFQKAFNAPVCTQSASNIAWLSNTWWSNCLLILEAVRYVRVFSTLRRNKAPQARHCTPPKPRPAKPQTGNIGGLLSFNHDG